MTHYKKRNGRNLQVHGSEDLGKDLVDLAKLSVTANITSQIIGKAKPY